MLHELNDGTVRECPIENDDVRVPISDVVNAENCVVEGYESSSGLFIVWEFFFKVIDKGDEMFVDGIGHLMVFWYLRHQ